MFLINILRFFNGIVRFRAFGGFGERFINLCSAKEITLWDVEASGNEIFASTSPKGYKKIRSAAGNSGMTTRIIKTSGLPFFVFRHRKKIGIPIGLMIFVLSISVLSSRIWLIDVDGSKTIPEETIISAVREAGLRIGSSKLSSDPVQIALKAGGKIDGISEISINISGSRATIKVKEQDTHPEVADSSGMYDLVASEDAQLIILRPYRGTVRAKVFNTVLKGEVLVSGVVQNRDESTGYVHSAGYAVGRTEKNISAQVLQNEKFSTLSCTGQRRSLFFLGIEIPLGISRKEADFTFKKEKCLFFSGKIMPAGFFITRYAKSDKSQRKLSKNETELICAERYAEAAKEYTTARQLISESCAEDFTGKSKTISGRFACYENIGIEKEFTINEEAG